MTEGATPRGNLSAPLLTRSLAMWSMGTSQETSLSSSFVQSPEAHDVWPVVAMVVESDLVLTLSSRSPVGILGDCCMSGGDA
jgi:hypothetical protein